MNLRDLFENSAHTGSHREVNARLQRILRRLQMAKPEVTIKLVADRWEGLPGADVAPATP